MTRSTTRIALVVVVFSALVGLGYLLGRTLGDQRRSERTEAPPEMSAEVTQRIESFRRVKLKEGRTVWELVAREAQYREEEKTVVVAEPRVSFFAENGDTVSVSAREGRVTLEGTNVDRIDLSGGIQAELAGYRLETETATFLSQNNSLSTGAAVRLKGPDFTLDGIGMVVSFEHQKVAVGREVRTNFLPGAPGLLSRGR